MSQKTSVLFASRAIESPPQEGGFVILTDLAKALADDDNIAPSVFSATNHKIENIGTERVFSKSGWNSRVRAEFAHGLFRKAHKFDVVHTAHIPTKQNVLLMRAATKRARRSGTRFVQTITGLPKVGMGLKELKMLLWGDHIVCQSQSVYNKVAQLRSTETVSLIVPWPSNNRISYDEKRRAKTRQKLFPGIEKVVVFPGEFDRLGVDTSFAECLKVFFEHSKNSIVVLACRFDEMGTGKKLVEQFPGKVISLGTTTQIIPLLEAADLVIYPVKKMHSKFQPPLVLMEALQLGTPVLVSTLIDLPTSTSSLLYSHNLGTGWIDFGVKLAQSVNTPIKRKSSSDDRSFNAIVKTYYNIYLSFSEK
jgi:glycosyltransferase involved in cell wall biosynthesis